MDIHFPMFIDSISEYQLKGQVGAFPPRDLLSAKSLSYSWLYVFGIEEYEKLLG